MKKATLLLVTSALFSAAGCQRTGDEVQPRSYDALALETGHWEWESTGRQGGLQTPATVGFTRQLVFGADGQVLIQHDGKLNKKPAYTLSMGLACAQPQVSVPRIAFETDSDVPNSNDKTYTITKSSTGQTLTLAGIAVCVDAGATELYHWVPE